MQFYYAVGDDKRGPVTIDQLAAAGVTADTLVWRSGMDDWTEARNLPDVMAALPAGRPPSPGVSPPAASPQYGNAPAYGSPSPQYGDNPPAQHGNAPQYGNPPAYGSPPPPQYGTPPASPPQYVNPLAYQPSGYQPVGYQPMAYVPPPAGQGLCTASLVLGIISLLTMCMYGLGIFAAIAGIICGHMGQSAFRKQNGRPNGMATAGLVCSYISLVLTVGIILFFVVILAAGA